ncbi:hypothetical protein ACFVU4_21230 [Streptomyces sp. NPDC058107]|uniref:hypothetical protein n=1 Tax=Streptomyces sp. NPDC058107 TaxID=3346343 RepID=UPI0036E098D7
MDWIPLLSTAVGAVIGVASTLIADWMRVNRSQKDGYQTLKRQLYGDYLAALSQTRHSLRTAAQSSSEPVEVRARMALDAFKDAKAYEARYQVALVASDRVTEASTSAFNALRNLRDLVESGGGTHSDPDYRAVQNQWADRFAELRRSMRSDLDRPVRQ